MPSAGVWPRGSTNMRVSKSMRGRRLAIATESDGVLHQAQPAFARHAGAQHDPRGGTGRQPGDADLIALAGHRRALDRRIEPHPVLGMEIVAPRRCHGEVDAGARRLGLGLGGDAAHQDAGGAPRRIQRLADLRVVRRPLGRGFQRLDRLGRAVQRLQRVGHQQQRRHLAPPRRRMPRNSARPPAARGWPPAACGASPLPRGPSTVPARHRPGRSGFPRRRPRPPSPACGSRRRPPAPPGGGPAACRRPGSVRSGCSHRRRCRPPARAG